MSRIAQSKAEFMRTVRRISQRKERATAAKKTRMSPIGAAGRMSPTILQPLFPELGERKPSPVYGSPRPVHADTRREALQHLKHNEAALERLAKLAQRHTPKKKGMIPEEVDFGSPFVPSGTRRPLSSPRSSPQRQTRKRSRSPSPVYQDGGRRRRRSRSRSQRRSRSRSHRRRSRRSRSRSRSHRRSRSRSHRRRSRSHRRRSRR